MVERYLTRTCAIAVAGLLLAVCRPAAAEPGIEELVRRAGNSESARVQMEAMESLASRSDVPKSVKKDARSMAEFLDRWMHDERLPFFSRPIHRKLDYPFGISQDSPLYPLTCLYRGKMLFWTTNEDGGILSSHERRRKFLDKAVRQFKIAREAFPQNRIVQMYLGTPYPAEKQYPGVPGAPKWAVGQRENLERLTDVMEWWIENRQREDGTYGGGWGDDCEMWRNWVAPMIAFQHKEATRAQALFSRNMFKQPFMRGGYTSYMQDVEHSAEYSKDTITPMMHLAHDEPTWRRRALRIAELMRTLWMGENERGNLQFKSVYFNASKIDNKRVYACDTPWHTYAAQPVLLLWQRTGNEKLERLITAWMDSWVAATASSERGKPGGVIPAAIRWPGGEPVGPGENWWDPQCHPSEPSLYRWPIAVRHLTDTLLLTYHMTGNEKYLQPLRSMAKIRLRWLKGEFPDSPEPGTEAWCGRRLRFLARTLAKYRQLTGKTEFDDVLERDYPAALSRHQLEESSPVVKRLQRSAEALRINFPGRTSEVRWTDRIMAFARMYGHDKMFAEPVPAMNKRPAPDFVYAMATGDRGGIGFFPLNAVRWLTPPRDIAAIVINAGRHGLTAKLFHFGESPRVMGAEFYLLESGEYRVVLTPEDEGAAPAVRKRLTVTGNSPQVKFTLPAREVYQLRVVRTK